MYFLLEKVDFHCYVRLPEGIFVSKLLPNKKRKKHRKIFRKTSTNPTSLGWLKFFLGLFVSFFLGGKPFFNQPFWEDFFHQPKETTETYREKTVFHTFFWPVVLFFPFQSHQGFNQLIPPHELTLIGFCFFGSRVVIPLFPP